MAAQTSYSSDTSYKNGAAALGVLKVTERERSLTPHRLWLPLNSFSQMSGTLKKI
jgi:hypothetical protein